MHHQYAQIVPHLITPQITDTIDSIAVIVQNFGISRHIGFLLKKSDHDGGGHIFLHQPWHLKRLFSPVPNNSDGPYSFIVHALLNLDEIELQSLSVSLYNYGKHNPDGIPYSVIYDSNAKYFENSKYVLIGDGNGLTCATFCMHILKEVGYTVIDELSYSTRSEAHDWPEYLLQNLISSCESVMHVDSQRQSNLVRFRPEEVAAAISLYSHGSPMNMEIAALHGERLVRSMTDISQNEIT